MAGMFLLVTGDLNEGFLPWMQPFVHVPIHVSYYARHACFVFWCGSAVPSWSGACISMHYVTTQYLGTLEACRDPFI
jgi:hypothetical protein